MIAGATTPEQVHANAQAASVRFNDDELVRLNEISQHLKASRFSDSSPSQP